MLLAYAISPYMSKQGGPRSVFFRNSIWVQMVSVVDRCKRVLVTLIRTLAGLYACSEESWLRTPLNTFSIEKTMKIKHSLEPLRLPLQAFGRASTELQRIFNWKNKHSLEPLKLPSQAFSRASTEPQRIFNWKNNENQELSWAVEAPVTSFRHNLKGASTHFQLKKQCKINFFDSLRPLVTLAF